MIDKEINELRERYPYLREVPGITAAMKRFSREQAVEILNSAEENLAAMERRQIRLADNNKRAKQEADPGSTKVQ